MKKKFGEVIHTIHGQRLYSQLASSIEAVSQRSSNKTYSMYLICVYIYMPVPIAARSRA